MIVAEHYILHDLMSVTMAMTIDCTEPGYVPIMFIGIYATIMLLGPGKISLDYFFSYFYLENTNRTETEIIGEK